MPVNKYIKRDRFFKVALSLIYKNGFKATTMRAIASELNFEVANVYNYISSKNELLETFLFGIQDEFHEALDHILDSSYDAPKKINMVINSYIQITSKRPYEQALLVNEWRNLKVPRRQEFVDRRQDYENKIKMIFEEGVKQGNFADMDTEIAVATILASIRWIYAKYIDGENKINPIELEKQLTQFILNGILSN